MVKIPFDDPKILSEQDKAATIAAAMVKSGGGFARMLGTKLAQMDIEEIEEFKENWSSYWNRYAKMAEVD